MKFIDINFLLFLFVSITIYFSLKQKYKKFFLMLINVIFIMSYGIMTLLLLLGLSCASYFAAIYMEKKEKYARLLLALIILGSCLVIIISRFFRSPYMSVCGMTKIYVMGASFWTLQILSYAIDVYNKKICAENNLLDYLLYVSFFGYITSGPIERSNRILPWCKNLTTNLLMIEHGMQNFIWGGGIKACIGATICYDRRYCI